MKIYLATIEHRYGGNLYTAKTQEGLTKQLYEYVKKYWSEIKDEEIPTDADEAIEQYFGDHFGETITYFEPVELSEIPD